jgi:hypothetical protein
MITTKSAVKAIAQIDKAVVLELIGNADHLPFERDQMYCETDKRSI